MLNNQDTIELQQRIQQAVADKTALQILSGNTKAFYGREINAHPLSVRHYTGIVNYYPSELVITAKAGTLLSEIKSVLKQQGQMLAFEPPHYGEKATLGGTIACGISGSRRVFTGSARDFVLGCKIINGRGEILRFGGEVIKNVAGYDVSRLMVGALGTLGVLLEISLKVLPLPKFEASLKMELNFNHALEKISKLCLQSFPLSAIAYYSGELFLRFSGTEKAVISAMQKIGGERLVDSEKFWESVNEQKHPFFNSTHNLWRVVVPPATQKLAINGEVFYDWSGGLRWIKTDNDCKHIFEIAKKADGHASLFKGSQKEDVFSPLSPRILKLHQGLKQAFDPQNIFNPQRMYKDV